MVFIGATASTCDIPAGYVARGSTVYFRPLWSAPLPNQVVRLYLTSLPGFVNLVCDTRCHSLPGTYLKVKVVPQTGSSRGLQTERGVHHRSQRRPCTPLTAQPVSGSRPRRDEVSFVSNRHWQGSITVHGQLAGPSLRQWLCHEGLVWKGVWTYA